MRIYDNGTIVTSLLFSLSLWLICVHGNVLNAKNLIPNGSFDSTFTQTGILLYWSCQGEQATYTPMLRTMMSSISKPYAGLCTRRTSFSQGPSIDIGNLIVGDGLYHVKGWTKLTKGTSSEQYNSIELWLRWKVKGTEEDNKLLGVRGKFLKNEDWVYWNTQFHLLNPASPFDYVILYFKGPPAHMDILIDDVTLVSIPQLEDWREHFNDRIDDIRKRDVVLRVKFDPDEFKAMDLVTSTTLQVKQVSSHFGWGGSVHYEGTENNPIYRNFIQKNFQWATMEHQLKWPFIETLQGVEDYSKTDAMLRTLQDEMRMKIRGHCIFWAVDDEQPKWLMKANPMQLKGAMWKRLHGVLNRYKNRITDWDVNNEMLHGSFYSDHMNDTIRDWMYYEAHRIFPQGHMFVNEFEVLSAPWFTQSYVEQIRSFLRKGIPIDGIGVQGHFAGHAHPEILKERLDALAVLGLPIWITELDVVAETDVKRADVLEKIIRVAYAHPAVRGIVLWTFWDKHEWKKNTSLFNGHYFKPNKAGKRYLSMRNEWKTNLIDLQPDDITSTECVFRFRAFHGEHVIKIRLPDGSVLEQLVDIKNNPGELELVFNKQSPEIQDPPD